MATNLPEFMPTPYVGTRIRFDTPETVLQEPPFGLTRDAAHAARSNDAFRNVRRVADIGFQLIPYQANAGAAAETAQAQSGIMRPLSDGGTLSASPLIGKFATYAQSDEEGLTYGADNVPSGDDHYEIQIPADMTVADAHLAADYAAFPSPASGAASVNDVRIFVDTVPDDPSRPLHLRITVHSAIAGANKELAKVMFCGPASQSQTPGGDTIGLGQYCYRLFGDGLAKLYERQTPHNGATDWALVQDAVRWCEPSQVAGTAHHVEIICQEFATPRGNRTGYVLIRSADSGTAAPEGSGSLLKIAGTTNPTGLTKYYATCANPKYWQPCRRVPVRFDHRADARPVVQIARPVYPSSGYVCDDATDMLCFPGYSAAEVRAYFVGDVPPGTSATVDLFRDGDDVGETGTPIVPTGRYTTSHGQSARYTLSPYALGGDVKRSFRVRVTLTSDGSATPTVTSIGLVKDGAQTTYDLGETVVVHPVLSISSSGVDYETGREAATLEFSDPHGKATALAFRAQMPYRIDVPYPNDGQVAVSPSSKRSVIERGYVAAASSAKLYRPYTQGLHPNARHYSIEATGMHQRLDESILPLAFDLVRDIDADAATGDTSTRLASDVIHYLLAWCGFPDSMIGWSLQDPRYPTRLFPKAGDSQLLNPGHPIGETAMEIARNYLGRYLDFEPNSQFTDPGASEPLGMWEMVDPPLIPYRPLARFEPAPLPGGTGKYLAHVPWPDWTFDGRSIPVRAFFRGETKRPEPPEFNWLMVVGLGDTTATYEPVALTTTAFNPKSLNVIASNPTLDPSDVSCVARPRRALYVDSMLSTPEAVQFVTRRLIDYAGTGRMVRTITAPLVLVDDPRSPYLRRKRRLRPNDCIVVRGRFCAVRSCALIGKRDGFQMTRIEAQELPVDPANPNP